MEHLFIYLLKSGTFIFNMPSINLKFVINYYFNDNFSFLIMILIIFILFFILHPLKWSFLNNKTFFTCTLRGTNFA